MSGEGSDIAGLRVLVVGASSGIGHAVAVRAAERGAKVAVAARRMDLLTELAEQIGGSAFELDVEDPGAIGRVVLEFPPIDIVPLVSHGYIVMLAQ